MGRNKNRKKRIMPIYTVVIETRLTGHRSVFKVGTCPATALISLSVLVKTGKRWLGLPYGFFFRPVLIIEEDDDQRGYPPFMSELMDMTIKTLAEDRDLSIEWLQSVTADML